MASELEAVCEFVKEVPRLCDWCGNPGDRAPGLGEVNRL